MFQLADGRQNVYQWDINVKLLLDESNKTADEVHFSARFSRVSLSVEVVHTVDSSYVTIPNILLQKPNDIIAYSYVTNADGSYTKYDTIIPVIARPKPSGYVYEETEILTWKSLDDKINALGESTANSVKYTEQTLTEEQQAQARTNIGAVSVDEVPIATNDVAGVVKPVSKTDEMTQPVGVDGNGELWTAPGSGGGGSSVSVDDTLTISGAAADAKATGDQIRALSDEIANRRSVLKGKYVSVLGDSISTYAGYIPYGYETYYTESNLASVDDTWWKKVIDATGMNLCVNESYSGTRVAVTSWIGDYAGCLPKRCMNLHTAEHIPDVIFVAMGCNDFNNEIAVGDYAASDGLNFDTSKFSDAYAQTLYNITSTYPASKVYCCTCVASERNSPAEGAEINGNGLAFYEFNDLIRKLARMFNCEVIDMESCGITHENLTYYMVDGVQHPNAYGHSLMANKVIETIDPSNGTRYVGLAPVVVIEETVAVTGVSLDQTAVSLEQWGTVQLTATITPADATTKTVQWKSSDDSVATVEDGIVTAVGEGDATITVTTDDGGYTATCTVSVTTASLSDVQVTSITNTPGQYIDTGYVPTANTRMELDWIAVENVQQSEMFGCRHFGIKTANATTTAAQNTYIGFLFSTFGSTWSSFHYTQPFTRSIFGVTMNYCYKDGEQVFNNPNGNANTPPTKSALIFGCNGWGTSDDLSTFGGCYTVYGFKIYESDELVKDFVPWVDADGSACLKEIIGGTYHYDATGGTFEYAG